MAADKSSDLLRERESDQKVWTGQQLLHAVIEPQIGFFALTSGAMPITARIIGLIYVVAIMTRAFSLMAAQDGSSTG